MPDSNRNVSAPSRALPVLAPRGSRILQRPISFVTVHFSGDIQHNLLASECVATPINELIVVDNRENLFFSTLGAALLHGVEQAQHALVALVHEDVLLLPDWQHAFESALAALEQHDPDWALLGAAGWKSDGTMVGHWSDPRGYCQLMSGEPFAAVDRIDEHLMILRKSGPLDIDPNLPSIHNIGRDLPKSAALLGLGTYVIDAPTVHKFADAGGRLINGVEDSQKILSRTSLTYLADVACSNAYLRVKRSPNRAVRSCDRVSGDDDAPIILLARGGGGSRLLSLLASDCGVHLGNEVSGSGDTMELVQQIYQAVLEEIRYRDPRLRDTFEVAWRDSIRAMRTRSGGASPWGFKLPELLLLAERLPRLFPAARFVHMVRDPLATCLRRTHMTARTDNHIGQASLIAAYRAAGLGPERILADSPAMHMGLTTRHQIGLVLDTLATLPSERYLELRMEDVLYSPGTAKTTFLSWLRNGSAASHADAPLTVGTSLDQAIDLNRIAHPVVRYAPWIAAEVAGELASLRRRLGYLA
ncbi:MAG: sulfotransferase [Pseudomonadota bacterium]|nr:sulfotransferase [Pseudomonadota bacterium]